MTDQEINREIAEAMTAQGFDEGLAWELQDKYIGTPDGHMILVPHNFTDPRYLLPALEAWRKQDPATRKWRIESAETWIESTDGITPERKDYGPAALIGDHLYMCDDLDRDPIAWSAEAFAAALGVGE